MLLHNKKKEFELSYDGRIFVIPEGKFHCNSILGTFIKGINVKWEDIDVEVLDNTQELIDLQNIVPVKEDETDKKVADKKVEEEVKDEIKK